MQTNSNAEVWRLDQGWLVWPMSLRISGDAGDWQQRKTNRHLICKLFEHVKLADAGNYAIVAKSNDSSARKFPAMISFATYSIVLSLAFFGVFLLVAWLKYREHLHAHRRDMEEHGHSEIRLRPYNRR